MRLSKQLCFLVAAAVASAVNGAPIGDVLQRRQEIVLELTPTQKVNVDGGRDVPTIVITEQGLPIAVHNNCAGWQSGSYSIEMPPVGCNEELSVPQTSYDPYSENYSPYPVYPPSRVMSPPSPMQSPPSSQPAPPRTLNVATPPTAGIESGPHANWIAPLIPDGSFDASQHGVVLTTPSMPGAFTPPSTTSKASTPEPAPVPATPTSTTPAPVQVSPPAPLPAAALSSPPTTAPTTAPPTSGVSATADKKPDAPLVVDDKRPDTSAPLASTPPTPAAPIAPTIPAPAPNSSDVHAILNDAAAANAHKDAEVKAPPHQRRSVRKGVAKPNSSPLVKRSNGQSRLRKRQLGRGEEAMQERPGPVEVQPKCGAQQVEQVEVLVPVTEKELMELQEGTVELVTYPSERPDGTFENVYDVVPVATGPEPMKPILKEVLEKGASKMMGTMEESDPEQSPAGKSADEGLPVEARSDTEQTIQRRSHGEDYQPNLRTVPSSGLLKELHKRLKHGSNAFNASMVGNGAGMTKYGYKIHDNANGSFAIAPLGAITTMSLAILLGVWATLL